ncbi:MAG: UvrD-helicase domain-containing protein [Bacteroidetes bacterium]|nr:UvrD-helicase domain-containing protein [Bacteroidota bacterium]
MNALKIFKSSAGSGKTFTLVKEYLKLVLAHPEDYRSILAITFTNKAAEEMKSRIVEALVDLSSGNKSPLLEILEKDLPKVNIRVRAEKSLKNILHDYSSFSVSTIDSFFQRILRALAREIHLPLKMEVEVSTDDAILAVTDSILREVGNDKELTDWLTDLALQKMGEEKGWNIENDIGVVAGELFKEDHHNKKILSREDIKRIYLELNRTRNVFTNKLKKIGDEALSIISGAGFSLNDFSYKEAGVAGYFQKISNPKNAASFLTGSRVEKGIDDPTSWTSKKSEYKSTLDDLVSTALLPLLQKAVAIVDNEYREYITANEVLKKIYLFGLVNDLQDKFREYRKENNVILLSDTTKLLGDMIEGNDTPFIYEKTGNRFKHLLIDEFQDTSLLQWKNLLPLVVNALGSGFMTLIVGDAKQSIYRWRGGNMNLLIRDIFTDLVNFKSIIQPEVLSTNFRSKKEIVSFNNQFFLNANEIANVQLDMNDHPILNLAYGKDLSQMVASKNDQSGYVEVNYINSEDAEDEDGEALKWKDLAMKNLLTEIRNQIANGFSYRDISILVRKNTEGNEIATFLLENEIDKIISPDSLLITGSPRINFLVNVLRFLADQKNAIARAEVLYYYALNIANLKFDKHTYFSDHKNFKYTGKTGKKDNTLFPPESLNESNFNSILPESFTSHLTYLANLPIYEISEQLVNIFGLNKKPDAFIQRFQDLVLEYNTGFDSSLEGFINWWDSSKKVRNASVITPQNEDAIQIITIHRSKGLQFPIVFMPFCDWKLLPKSNELIWLQTNQEPFSELGKTALVTTNALKETYYSENYNEEVNQTVIDNMNMLYVAFTRAEEKLFIYCPQDNKKDLNSVSKLISRTCHQLDPEQIDTFSKGENFIKPKSDKNKLNSTSTDLRIYPSNRWQDKLSLSSHGNDLIEMIEKKDMTKVNYGILIHALLAEVKDTSEFKHLADKFVFDGLITDDQKKILLEEVETVLKVEEIAGLFSKEYEVKAEKEIILPTGEVLRPDRVIIKNKEAIVIDFKSGQPHKKHENQVTQYADILRKMGYSPVSSKLVYLTNRSVISV